MQNFVEIKSLSYLNLPKIQWTFITQCIDFSWL